VLAWRVTQKHCQRAVTSVRVLQTAKRRSPTLLVVATSEECQQWRHRLARLAVNAQTDVRGAMTLPHAPAVIIGTSEHLNPLLRDPGYAIRDVVVFGAAAIDGYEAITAVVNGRKHSTKSKRPKARRCPS
jgi:hypothetical protein